MSKQKHKKFIVSLERHLYQTDKILGGGMLGCPPHCMNPSLAKILWLTIHQHKYIKYCYVFVAHTKPEFVIFQSRGEGETCGCGMRSTLGD